ncbi:hypothetical protein ACFWY6_43870 [Streptomyces sp. NPDC059037]|uniref:hypothetical protein n=1 Tax=Streptomyces sp. NPDC059037 TaxID=3346710 RepID=UPI003674D21E
MTAKSMHMSAMSAIPHGAANLLSRMSWLSRLNLLSQLPKRPLLERWATRAAGAALAAAAYLVCLPWDLRNRPETPGAINETSPVSAPGVIFLAVSMLALAAYFGFRDRLVLALLLVAGPPATLMYVSFDSHPEPDAAVWPVAWAFFTLVMGAGVLAVAGFARLFRDSEG